ncbi:MAG: apolipoprotein N-acyltransferase [Acidimicrobiia bacterium]|nr:apolipoprotein N-acyltransferase [Acidimicrobiia bacterium]MBT8215292.1 apolipoprotein N-acyltransferase [Acidimicrobiia bacterium]NNF09632.1 apolipoprotein N-acyltransferase [Acidimicrobiia bacterium]NNL71473.1 apolipoprotein N-acyltransferase [Acidimicrobiia bacterium]
MLIELAPLLSAFLLWAAFRPLGWGALAFVALTPLLAAIRRVNTIRSAAGLGFVFGVGFFTPLVFWVKETGYLSLVALVLLLSAYSTLFAVMTFYARRWGRTAWFFVTVGAWAAIELIRVYVPFGGFSWGLLGYPAGEYGWTRGATQLIGTTGWSVVFIAIAAGLTLFVTDRRRPARWVVPPVALVVVLMLFGAIAPPVADGASVSVAIVQGNSPCPDVHCANENELIFQSHLALTKTIRTGQAELVVWPESSAGSSVELATHPDRLTQVAAEARRLDAWFLIGSQRNLDADSFTNLNLVLDADGTIVGEYRKRHPVPFGEYVPLRPLFDWIPALDQVPRDLLPGDENTVFELPGGTLGSVISFEGAFARSTRAMVREGAQLLVVATNKASFGDTPVSDQFIGMTRMRAAELGTGVVHAAITGRSAFIDADGSLQSRTEAFESDVLFGTAVYRSAGLTPYARLGDWLQYLAIGVGSAIAVAAIAQQRRTRVPALEED